jgi:hypothetical protein
VVVVELAAEMLVLGDDMAELPTLEDTPTDAGLDAAILLVIAVDVGFTTDDIAYETLRV